jgi:hypothetical protein
VAAREMSAAFYSLGEWFNLPQTSSASTICRSSLKGLDWSRSLLAPHSAFASRNAEGSDLSEPLLFNHQSAITTRECVVPPTDSPPSLRSARRPATKAKRTGNSSLQQIVRK